MEEVVFVSARGIQSSLIFLFSFYTCALFLLWHIRMSLSSGLPTGRVAGGLTKKENKPTEGLFVLPASHESWF